MAHPAPAGPHCPRCGAAAVWHAQLNQWGCDHCRQMLPQQQAQQPAMQQPPMQHPPHHYQPPPVQPMTPPCPQCRGPSTYYAAANTFGCDRCRIPVASPIPMQQQGSDAGAIALKIIGFIVLIIVIVVIRVAIKAGMR